MNLLKTDLLILTYPNLTNLTYSDYINIPIYLMTIKLTKLDTTTT